MKKILISGIIICSFLSCRAKKNKNEYNTFLSQIVSSQNKALHFLDSLHYLNYYKESKWKIYLKYCDKQIVKDDVGNKIKAAKYFGELPLYLTSARMENDSLLSLTFEAILGDSIFVSNESFNDSSLKYTYNRYLYYNVLKKTLYGYGIGSGIHVDSIELNDYCKGILNCNKKVFIKEHKEDFNEWFIKEAVKRSFIKE